eukprot:jgi/Botrbrau1/20182/Bobra.0173s0080.1
MGVADSVNTIGKAGRMNFQMKAVVFLMLSVAVSAQMPITVPASVAQPYVQNAADILTNATQAGANFVGAAAGQGLTGLLSLGNTAFAGMAAAMNSTATMMAAGLQPLAQARYQVNAALQNATGIAVPADIGPAATIAANARAALASSPGAQPSSGNSPGNGLAPGPSLAMAPGLEAASVPDSTATCSITLESPPTSTVTCEPVLLKVLVEAPASAGQPTGKVTFWSDGVAISPSMELVNGSVAYNYTGFMVGSHSVFATYSGGGACPLGVSASILRQVTPAKVSVNINPSPGAQRYPNCDWRQQRFDVSVQSDGPHCAAPTGIVNVYLIAGDNWNAANFTLPPTDPLPSINPYSINTRFPAIGQIGQAVTRAGNIFINTVTQATGSVISRFQDSPIFRRLIGIGALLPPAVQSTAPSTVSINLMRQLMGLVPGPYSVIASYAGDQNFQAAYGGSNFAIDLSCALPTTEG